jgi:hypothetical protein
MNALITVLALETDSCCVQYFQDISDPVANRIKVLGA